MLNQIQHKDNKKGLLERLAFLKKILGKPNNKRTPLNYNELVRRFRSKIEKK
jgi:hypothetical protein